jgi:hypothetical protein
MGDMYRTIVVAVLAGLVLTSCGQSEVKLTRTQMLRQVHAACNAASKETTRAASAARGSPQMRLLTGYIAGQRVLVARLEDLNPPDALKRDFDGFRHDMRQRLDLFLKVQAAGPQGFSRATAAYENEQRAIFIRLDRVNHKYELTGCV